MDWNNNTTYHVKVKAFICDASATAFLKNTKCHTGYRSCERCKIVGYWKDNWVVVHSNATYPRQTDAEFVTRSYGSHHNGHIPLTDFHISCVSGFCLDYMHLVCLGVVKRMFWFLRQGPKHCKLSQRQISEISENLVFYSGKMPSEFVR